MARAATTADAFNAVAEPRRREILDVLAGGERTVSELVELLDLAQPHVSRHLRVLRENGFATVRAEGARRLYAVGSDPLREVDQWLDRFRAFWSQHLDALGTELARGRRQRRTPPNTEENQR